MKTTLKPWEQDRVLPGEAVGAGQCLARGHVLLDLFVVGRLVEFIGEKDMDDVGLCRGFGSGHHLEAVCNRSVKGGAFAGADDHVDAGVSHAERLCAALAAVADHGDCFSV